MTLSFRPAALEGVGLFVAIAGSSRTGKTYSALRMARGIVGPGGKIAAVDTEGRRMSHYSREFAFDVCNMPSPFGGQRFAEMAKKAEDDGYGCLVIDSFSLEWSGVGGVLEEYDRHFEATNNNPKMKDVCWDRAKRPHKRMMNDLIQRTIPIVFCLRANEVPDHLGGGWKVEQDKRFLYEWTVGLTLHPDTPGMPRYDMVDAKRKPLWKVQDQHRPLFPERQLIGEDAGAALQEWRNSDAARAGGSTSAPKRTMSEWLADLEEFLSVADSLDAVEARLARDDVVKALASGHDKLVPRVNDLAREALARFSGAAAFSPADAQAQS